MPTYTTISEETIKYWEIYLDQILTELIARPSICLLRLFILALNEYIFTKATFWDKSNGNYGVSLEGAKGGLTQVRCYITSKKASEDAKKLMDLANDVRHVPSELKGNDLVFLYEATASSGYAELWEVFIPKSMKLYGVLHDENILLAIKIEIDDSESGELKQKCINIARKCLRVNTELERSNCTVSQTVKKLMRDTGCSEGYALSIVYKFIGNDWRVKTY